MRRYHIISKLVRPRYFVITVFAFIAIAFLAFVTFNLSFLNPLSQMLKNFSFSDLYYQISSSSGIHDRNIGITMVDMTTLYDRKDISQALKDVESCDPKAVGVDIVFEGLLDDEEGNDSLFSVAQSYDNIVYSYRVTDYQNDETGYGNEVHSFFTDYLTVKEGCTNMERSLYDNTKRELSLKCKSLGQWHPSFVTMLVNEFAGDNVVESDNELMEINFVPTDFTVLNADSVLHHPELIEGRIVLFGAMQEESDMHYTPIGKMAGMELLAYAVQALIDHRDVKELPKAWFWVVTFLLVYLTQLLNDGFISLTDRIRHENLRAVVSSSYVVSIVTFIWMALLTGIAFVVFYRFNFNFNLGWAFAAMACLEISKDLYEAGGKLRKK